MSSGFALPPPLDIHDADVAEKWKKFRLAWDNYSLAMELDKKSHGIQVATLFTIIGEEARDVYLTFADWADEDDKTKIEPVLKKFAEYCQPRQNVPFERYRFKEPGETYDQYRTALRKLADGYEFQAITPDEILRDRLVFGIRDVKVRERLLRESKLTLQKTDEICRASESTIAQMKLVGNDMGQVVNVVNTEKRYSQKQQRRRQRRRQKHVEIVVEYTSQRVAQLVVKHATTKKINHFAAMCRGKKKRTTTLVRADEPEESDSDETGELYTYVIGDIAAVALDDSQHVTLRLESGNYLRFQPDTGPQCNVIPVHLYKKASKDYELKKVKKVKTAITAYGGLRLPVVSQVVIQVWRDKFKCLLDCKLVDSKDIRPILGRKA